MKIQNLRQKNSKLLVVNSILLVGNYLPDNEIKFLTSSLGSDLCDFSDAYRLLTGSIRITRNQNQDYGNQNTKVAFKNCAPLKNIGQK